MRVKGVALLENHVKMVVVVLGHGLETLDHALPPGIIRHQIERQIGRCQAAEDQEKHLNHVGVADDLHAAQRNDDGKSGQCPHTKIEIEAGDTGNG